MARLINILFLNEQGKISWTTIAAFFALLIGFHTYIDIWWLHKEYSAALLQFALEIILAGLGVRGAQRGLQYLGEGVGSITKKHKAEGNPAAVKETPAAPKPPLQKHTGNFSLAEFASPDGEATPPHAQANLNMLIANLEVIRAALGNRPIAISSGYRSPAYNAKVGGAARSQHLLGNAADIKVQGLKPATVKKTIKQLIDQGKIEAGGLRAYSTFVHYDRRGEYVTW